MSTSYNVDKMLGQEPSKATTKKPNPFLSILLVFYLSFMSLILLGGMIGVSEKIPGFLVFLLVSLCIGLPLFLKKKLNIPWRKRHITALSLLGTIILLMMIGLPPSSSSSDSHSETIANAENTADTQPSSEASNHYAIGDQFQVGYTQYKVLSKKWQRQLGNEYFGSTADGRYLLIRIQVKNLDREERMVPQFTLVDETGAEYKESHDSLYLGKEAQFMKSLNPSVQTKLIALFDVPPEHHYTLRLRGGYWSSDEAFVKLN
jgi:hypothetical protein